MRHGRRWAEVEALNAVAAVLCQLDSYERATWHYREALRTAESLNTGTQCVTALRGLAEVYGRDCQYDLAMQHADQALQVARQRGYLAFEGQVRTTIAAIHLDRDEPGAAVKAAEDALAIHEETGYRLGAAHAMAILGRALYVTGRTDAGAAYRARSLAALTEIGAPWPSTMDT